ncbi:MAG TPA: amino acid adenylation domain-containing protein, partial [Burkholderiaceae bacterium]|nr:amino acid adenylation domain-containing protein [Burkholderiaceae bacterium]
MQMQTASSEEQCASGISTYALSSAQQVIWVDQMANPDVPYYNIGMAVRLDGKVDPALLQRAINLVANQNDALRLCLVEENGVPRQHVLPSIHVELALADFSAAENREAQAEAWLREAFARPFNPLRGVLWESRLVRVHDSCYYWLNRFHHLVADAIGVGLYGHGVAAAYNGLREGRLEVEPAPSYIDFLSEDRAYLASNRFERDRDFWCERYARLPPPLFERTSERGLNSVSPSGRVRWWIQRNLYDRLARFAADHGHSMAHVLHAAFSAYFARTRGVEEVVIGMPVHNRTTPRLKRTVGLFSSVSPIGLTVDTSRSFLALMDEVGAELRRCYRHQRFPIAELNRTLKLAQAGRRQLFDMTLSFENLDGDDCFGEAPCTTLAMDNGHEQNPLAVFVRNYFASTGRDVMVDFHYNKSILQESDVLRIQAHIALLLERIEAHADTPVNQLPLLSEAERRQVLVEFNDTTRTYPADRLIHQLFEAQAAARPEAVAAVCEDCHLTYAALNARANQLAHRLIDAGVRPDDRIAVCLERSLDMVIGLLAVLKAGGAYVPLDPGLPRERLGYMLRDSAPVALLTWRSLQGVLPDLAVPVLWLDADAQEFASWPVHNPDPAAQGLEARHLAYVLYTSGSTGQPKGVMNEHRGVVNRLLWAQDEYGLGHDDSVMQKTPFGFDVSVWEFFLPLLAGARLVMARPQGHLDPVYLRELIARARITTMHFVPSMLSAFLEQATSASCAPLRRVLCSGEALPHALQQRFFQVLPGVALSNLYGPTEAAIDVTCWHCAPGLHPGLVPIGRPVANTQIHVLDAQLQPVPVGCPGEIHIGGVQVARGYLHRPALTAERFIEDPFSAVPGARLYKTGDLGRWLPDGAIAYLGRNDHQVKLRGLRIELGEIETQLAACPGIREAAVLAREDGAGEKCLVAYYTGASQQAEALRTRLLAMLPAYMVPAAYVWLAALPLNANGKLDRSALPVPDAGALATRAYEPPQGEAETLVASFWQDMLGVERVGRHDQFFE